MICPLRPRFTSYPYDEATSNYRLLYFFRGRQVAILAHALTKEGKVPEEDIERAIRRRQAVEQNPDAHYYEDG